MKPMLQTADHTTLPVRIYEDDQYHDVRIIRTRQALHRIIQPQFSIVELGCGTGDISGSVSDICTVKGFECNVLAAATALERFPNLSVGVCDMMHVPAVPCDVIIMTEMLEHMEYPIALVKSWFPQAQYSLISHPLEEPQDSDLSGGEHRWSYDHIDFLNWFRFGGHELIYFDVFKLGDYTDVLGIGKRI